MKKLFIIFITLVIINNAYSTEKSIGSTTSTGRWIKVAKIQNQNPIGSSERSQFSGYLNAQTYFGYTGSQQYSAIFSFGCRGGIKPLLFEIGDAAQEGKAGRIEWRIYQDPDGYHYLWLWQCSYSNYLEFNYKNYYGVEYWTFEDPPTNYTLVWSSYAGERQTISNTNFYGKVGIGTTNPYAKLHINGSFYLSNTTTAVNTTINQEAGNLINNFNSYTGLLIKKLGTGTGDYFAVETNTAAPLFYIKSTGNILIGKATQQNPNYKLDVAGTIRANEIKVNLDGADFVFDTNYKLKSLEEVETFVKENKHLPDIESAKEMCTDGTNLGELNTKLLQKVEELTLYMIEQNKRINKLEEENNLLKTKLDIVQ